MQLMFSLFVNNDITALKIAGERPHFVRAVTDYFAGGNIVIPSKLNINTLLFFYLYNLDRYTIEQQIIKYYFIIRYTIARRSIK